MDQNESSQVKKKLEKKGFCGCFCSFSDLVKARKMLRRLFSACCKGPKRSTHLKDPSGTLELGNLIGDGSYGQVYKGHNLKTNKVVAIKTMTPSEDNLKQIKREIKIHMKVSTHKNIASFYGAYQQPGSIMMPIMIEMEFCGGGTLSELIENPFSQYLSEHCIAYVCREVLKGLYHLQKKQIMHRDIKPLNIVITEDADIRLIDFGLARIVKKDRPCNELLGTPHYIAPEVWLCRAHDFKCDIWSLGMTAIEMAEGESPLLQTQKVAIGKEVVYGDPPSLSRPRRWSKAFNSFIEVCLTKDPKDRPTAKFLLQNHPFITKLQDKMQVKAEIKDLVRRLNAARHWQEDKVEIQSDVEIEEKVENAEDVDLCSKTAENAAFLPQDVGSTDIKKKQDTIYHTDIGKSKKVVEASTTPKEDRLQSSRRDPVLEENTGDVDTRKTSGYIGL